jgi:phage gp29-like protein
MANDLSGIIDQDGKPITRAQIAQLREPIAAPSSYSARPPFAGHLAFGIDPGRLGALIRGADNFNTRDWFILCEEIEELFPHYAAVLGKRKRQVSLLPVTVEKAPDVKDGQKHADFVTEWLNTEVLQRVTFDVLDAVGKSYSVNEIMWETKPGRVWPAEIIWRHQRDFEVSWEDGEAIWLRDNAGFTPLAKHKFLLHAHKSKSGGAARSGLTRMVAWMWMYSMFTLKDWALFVQGYGLPVRLGRYGPEASDEDKRVLFRAVRSIGGDLAATIPKSMEMEFVEAKAATEGAKLFSERANWLNYEVSKLVLGGTAGTDAIAGGHAVGQEHRSAEQDVEKFDARLLAGSVNRQIVPAMIAFTFGPQESYPRIVIGQEEMAPISDVIAAVADLAPLGFRVKAANVRDRLQLEKPEPGDEVIELGPAAAPGAKLDANGDPIVADDVKIKANPHPEINPNSDARALMSNQARLFGRLIAQNTPQAAPIMDALSARLEREAGVALGGMTAQVRQCFEEARDMADLRDRLHGLKLDDAAFANAMMQGLALANLAGQAALLDEIAPHARGGA